MPRCVLLILDSNGEFLGHRVRALDDRSQNDAFDSRLILCSSALIGDIFDPRIIEGNNLPSRAQNLR